MSPIASEQLLSSDRFRRTSRRGPRRNGVTGEPPRSRPAKPRRVSAGRWLPDRCAGWCRGMGREHDAEHPGDRGRWEGLSRAILLPLRPVPVMHAIKNCRSHLAPQAAAGARGPGPQVSRRDDAFAPAIATTQPGSAPLDAGRSADHTQPAEPLARHVDERGSARRRCNPGTLLFAESPTSLSR